MEKKQMIDMHCHILPGVDDGPKELEESVAMARELHENGFEAVMATPHVMDNEKFGNNHETIHNALNLVRDAVEKEGIPIKIYPGAEYYFDRDFHELARYHNPLVSMANSYYVLVEFPIIQMPVYIDYPTFANPDDPSDLYHTLPFLRPVVAHPERYQYVFRDYDILMPLREKGYFFQVNLESVLGFSGKGVVKVIKKMSKAGLIDLVGTDGHTFKGIRELFGKGWRKKVDKVLGPQRAQLAMVDNPKRIIDKVSMELELY
jgi:protein-tyrosine phosphatase